MFNFFLSRTGIVLLYLLGYLTVLPLVKDYGIPWDEPYQQSIGEANYAYIFHINMDLLDSHDKYYGPLWETLLFVIETKLNHLSPRTIYLIRHYADFTLFYIGCGFLYKITQEIWHSKFLGVLGVILLLASPRIIAESFYNSKDIPFLVLYLISTYTLLRYLKNKTITNLIILGLVVAACTGVRIGGIFILVYTTILQFLHAALCLNYRQINLSKLLISHLFLNISVTGVAIYALYPVIWSNPADLFKIFTLMSHYEWPGPVLYIGKYIYTNQLPWHYSLVWIAITTPLSILLFSLLGIGRLMKQLRRLTQTTKDNFYMLVLILPIYFIPLGLPILMHSTLYDGWRHLYFIYPGVILFALYFLFSIGKLKHSRKKFIVKTIITVMLTVDVVQSALFMIKHHPYGFVYFNRLAGKDYPTIKSSYELDYWSVSSRQVLEQVALKHPGNLNIVTDVHPIIYNLNMLPQSQKNNLNIQLVDQETAKNSDIFIGSYRWHPEPYPCTGLIYSSAINNAPLVSAFKAQSCDFSKIIPQ